MRTTIRDVAMAAGCSITAVSLVLNGKTRNISAQTEARILDAAKQLNYHPNKLASHLVTKKSNIIGLILPDNCNLFFGMVLFSGERLPGIGTMAVFLAGLLILLMLFTAFWPQVVLFEESNLHRLQNAVLFCLKYGRHVLGAATLQLVWWLLFVLFLPWTGFLVPFLGVWFIWFVCFFLLYSDFDAAYGIEEKIRQQFPEQTPRYDE